MAFQAHVESLLSKCQYHPNTRSYLAQEVQYVISRYPSLQVQLTDLVFYNQARVFLCLNGTIPVPYKGSTYNIPVRIIYPDPYPSIAPIARVIPTANMFVRSSEYVDEDGTVKLNLLHSWNYTYTTLIDQLIAAFSTKMPVYSRPSTAPAHPAHPAHPAQPVPHPMHPQQVQPSRPLYVPDPNLLNLLKTNYEKVYKDLQDEIAKLKSERQALDADAQQVAEYIQKANSEQPKINSTKQAMETTLQSVESWLEVNSSASLSSVPEEQLYVPLDAPCRQLLGLLSAERALEDTIEKIQRAFDNRQISADAMVRTLKKLNSQLFMTTKLREKVEKARG